MRDNKISNLAEQLFSKDEKTRYKAFLSLKDASAESADVYAYWDQFRKMLQSKSSYQRSIGMLLMGENARWDSEGKLEQDYRQLLSLCEDEKFITSRQAIQNIPAWVEYLPDRRDEVAAFLMNLDLSVYKDSQVNLIRMDILQTLGSIDQLSPSEEIQHFIQKVLSAHPELKKNLPKKDRTQGNKKIS